MRFFAGVFVALGIAPTTFAAAVGVNLVVNGDFETGDISGWTAGAGQIAMSSVPGTAGLSDPAKTGVWVVTGSGASGVGLQEVVVQQFIDFASNAAGVDAGNLEATIGADLFNVESTFLPGNAGAAATVRYYFRDGAGANLTPQPIALLNNALGWQESLLLRETIPVGARGVLVEVVSLATVGNTGDAFIDNVVFQLRPFGVIPEPGVASLFGLAAGLMLLRRRRPIA